MKQLFLKSIGLFCGILTSGVAFAQPTSTGLAKVVDTIIVGNDTAVLFSDKSWEYLEVLNFDGIMNHELHELVQADTNYRFFQDWNNEDCYSTVNHLREMHDTIWICTVDSMFKDWCVPVEGAVVSTFKYRGRRFHHGIDLDLDTGDPVKAAFDGRVRYAKYNNSGFGNLVIIRHDNGLETYYAHLSKLHVIPNERVVAGQVIGLGGETGRATGPHLHFEVRFYDNALDPELVFNFNEKRLTDENLLVHKGLFDYQKVSRSKSSSGRSSSSSSSSRSSTANKDVKFHKVRSGDSLYKIARKYGTSIDALVKLNDMNRDDILRVGRTLRIRK